MKYTEKIGDVETVYEGTPSEIMELYIKMNPEEDNEECCDNVRQIFEPVINIDCELDTDKIGNEIARKVSVALNQI